MARPLLTALAFLPLTAGLAMAIEPVPSAAPRPDVVRCATPHLRETIGNAEWSVPGMHRALPCDITPVGPPPSPTVGSSWDWYIWMLNGPPTAVLRSCTVRGMGANCYVVVEDSQWNVNVDQTQVDTIVDRFENTSIGPYPTQGIWDLDTGHFGMPPDNLDQDPRVYILYYDFDVSSDGFFWGFDQECDNVALYHSNECDVVYMNSSDFDPAGDYLLAVLAHELEHLIHYNYDPNETSWVDEGLAELAMWLYGNPDNIVQFNTFPDRALNTFSGNFYDYVKMYLWTLYFFERYGGQPVISALVQEPGNGITGYNAVLTAFSYAERFPDVFRDWVVANFLDDTSIGDGRYGYVGAALPPFAVVGNFSSYPVGPNNSTVLHWAADYVRYQNGNALAMTFDGSDDNSFAVRALLLDTVNPTEVVDLALDGAQAGMLPLPQIGTTHDQVVMVYAGASNTGGTVYQYGAVQVAVDAPEVSTAAALSLTVRGSISERPVFVLSIPASGEGAPTRLEIFDVSGRRVRRLVDAPGMAGRRELPWDGRADDGAAAAPGTYFARLVSGAERATARVTLR